MHKSLSKAARAHITSGHLRETSGNELSGKRSALVFSCDLLEPLHELIVCRDRQRNGGLRRARSTHTLQQQSTNISHGFGTVRVCGIVRVIGFGKAKDFGKPELT